MADASGGEGSTLRTSSKMARSRRRMRFRTTAFPTFRDIEYAICGVLVESVLMSSRRYRHRRSRDRTCSPSDRSRTNSARSVIPEIKPTACGDPYGVGSSRSLDPPGSTSAGESRASSTASGHLADTCASSLLRIVWARNRCTPMASHAMAVEVGHTRAPRVKRTNQCYGHAVPRSNQAVRFDVVLSPREDHIRLRRVARLSNDFPGYPHPVGARLGDARG
jgi:hypothetical protein